MPVAKKQGAQCIQQKNQMKRKLRILRLKNSWEISSSGISKLIPCRVGFLPPSLYTFLPPPDRHFWVLGILQF
jgi:hypothetical protein